MTLSFATSAEAKPIQLRAVDRRPGVALLVHNQVERRLPLQNQSL
jgi:hypothetical protein